MFSQATFTITAEGILEQAKTAFLSERYDIGFEILRDCFEESDVSDQTIFDFLNAKIGVKIEGDEVFFGSEHEIDKDYKEDIDSVLFELRNLYRDKEFGMLNIAQYFPFALDEYYSAEKNEALKELKNCQGKVIRTRQTILAKAGITSWGDFMYIDKDGIFFLNDNKKTIIAEVSTINEDITVVADRYREYHCY